MIQLNNVTKAYLNGKVAIEALRGIDLTIENGEMIAVMGTSGSGKSTLLNIIGCMDRLSGGEYLLDGENVSSLKKNKFHIFRKEHISFVFQHFALMRNYTVYENVEIPLLAKNIKKRERKRIVGESLELLGIKELEKSFPNNISGGQQQRCAIARALASGNKIILADEPTGALDQNTSQEIMDSLEKINKNGKTIIIVTHDFEVAERCRRIVRIVDGMICDDKHVDKR